MILQSTDYGVLGPLVGGAGALISATAAIGLAWRGRASWEPSEEDVAKGPQKVAGLVAAVAIAILWAQTRSSPDDGYLGLLAAGLTGSCVVFLLIYGFVIATQTYDVVFIPASSRRPETRKVIGGFWLTAEAKATKKERNVTTQEVLKGSEYDVDKVWSRGARALAKTVFVLCYMGLVVSGTVALACAAILLG